LTDAAAVVV